MVYMQRCEDTKYKRPICSSEHDAKSACAVPGVHAVLTGENLLTSATKFCCPEKKK